MAGGKNDRIIIIAVVSVAVIVLAAAGIIVFSKGSKKKQELKAKSNAARQNALKGGATKSQAEKQATLAMVAPAEKAKVEKELAKITEGKTEAQAEVAVKQYQAKVEEANSGILSTISTGVSETISDVKDTLSSFVTTLKSIAEGEYKFWNGAKEGDKRTLDRLRQYWKEGAGVMNWDDKKMTNEAWSAAFISYIMKKAGAGKDWKYSASHSTYINDSIKNRKDNNDKPFKAFKPNEVKVAVGDLVSYPRGGSVTYDTANKIGSYASHTDLVVNIKNGIAETLGGNISNSVSITKVPLTADGKIDTAKAKNSYFAVIKNMK
jgi:hypothetical protein